jgi:hypothetical protein
MGHAEPTDRYFVDCAALELGIWVDTDRCDPNGAVFVTAHHALWGVLHDEDTIPGWIAFRCDNTQREIPGTAGWLGASDLDADQILDNLLSKAELPADLYGHRVPTGHPYQLEPPDDAYLDCPACRHIAPVEEADYLLTADGRVDLDQPVLVRCAVCGDQTDGRPHARIRTRDHTCPQCHTTTRAPEWPSRIACSACRTRFVADAITGTALEAELHRIEQQRGQTQSEPQP